MRVGFISLTGGLIIEYSWGKYCHYFYFFSPLFIKFKCFIFGLIVLSFPFFVIQLQLEKRKAKMKENHSFFQWEKDSLSEGWVEKYCSCCKIQLLANISCVQCITLEWEEVVEETFYSSIMLSHAWCAAFFWMNLSCWLTCWEICSAPSQKKGGNIRKIKIHLTAKLLYNEHHVTCLNTQWLILIKVNPENHARQRNIKQVIMYFNI